MAGSAIRKGGKMALTNTDIKGNVIETYTCPECKGKTMIRWRPLERSKREQYILVNHLAQCKTGIESYNLAHPRKEKSKWLAKTQTTPNL